jgi:hypothetical protein
MRKYIFLIFLILFIGSAHAYTLNSVSIGNSSIFPCQDTTITVVFDSPVSSVSLIFINQPITEQGTVIYNTTSVSMSTGDSITWTASYGNNPSLKWGKKTVYLFVNGVDTIDTGAKIFVYNNGYIPCVGSDASSYRNYVSGIGKYTNLLLKNDISFLDWAVYPWEEALGYTFYMFVVFTICTSIYFKAQNVMQPTIVAIFLLIVGGVASITVDSNIRPWILIALALSFGVVYYRLMVKE